MKRLLTAGIFGTILGIVGAGTANASIVSSGFLDEKLTEYALSTSLDLKANQSDFTELNTQISDSIANLKTLWDGSIRELAYAFDPNIVNNNINGAFDLVGGFLYHSMISLTSGWTNSDGEIFRGIIDLNYGWTDSNDGTTYLGVKDLNTKIGTLPDGITLENFYNGWVNSGGVSMTKEIAIQGGNGMVSTYDPVRDDFGPQRFPDLGYLGVLAKLINGEGIAPTEDITLAPFWYLTKQAMRVGEIPRGKTAAGMIDEINTKIGTLPSGDLPSFPLRDVLFPKLNQPLTYPTSLAELISAIYGNSETRQSGLLAGIISGFLVDNDQDGRPETPIGIVPNHELAEHAQKLAIEYGAKIGTLPTGNLPRSPIYELIFPLNGLPTTYPTSLSDLIAVLFGDGEKNPGIINLFAGGFNTAGPQAGIIPAMNAAASAQIAADSANAKIGTLPSGNLPQVPEYNDIFPLNNLPTTYPTSLSELITVLFGDGKTQGGIIDKLIGGLNTRGLFYYETAGILPAMSAITTANAKIGTVPNGKNLAGMISETDAKIGTVPDGKNLAGMISETDAKIGTVPDGKNLAGMIGTLPAGYDSVGAALSAIKGIAEDAKAAALAAIPDPKQEGSSGKFVLTVDIVGDNATYHWEKIDREGEATTTE